MGGLSGTLAYRNFGLGALWGAAIAAFCTLPPQPAWVVPALLDSSPRLRDRRVAVTAHQSARSQPRGSLTQIKVAPVSRALEP